MDPGVRTAGWMLLAAIGGLIYHFSQKSIPKGVDPLLAVILAYACGIACLAILWVLISPRATLSSSQNAINWAVWTMGAGAALAEVGFLLAYRSGSHVNSTSMVVNVTVAILLIPIGTYVFREGLSWRTVIGIGFCIVGLVLLRPK